MKKLNSTTTILLSVILILSGIGFVYLIYEIWNIFGFWRLTLTGVIEVLASIIFLQFLGSAKSESNGVVIYNPKEWPKLLGIAVFIGVAYYLYDYIEKKEDLSELEYYYGLSYLIILSLVPTLIFLYKLIRDSRDYVKINNGVLSYKDNRVSEEFNLSDIESCESKNNGVLLNLKDKTTHFIPLKKMNFNFRDRLNLTSELDDIIKQMKK
jgi:hypothetical protein